jgi:hypothetical protein
MEDDKTGDYILGALNLAYIRLFVLYQSREDPLAPREKTKTVFEALSSQILSISDAV